MKYVKFKVSTEYCGTEEEIFSAYEDNVTENMLDQELLALTYNQAEHYEYLATGWNNENLENPDDEEELEQVLNDFYEEAENYSNWEYITEKEYKEGTE